MERTQPHETEANFSIDEYGAKTAETEECEEQLLAEYGTLLGFYLASAAVLTEIAVQQNRLPRKFGLLDLGTAWNSHAQAEPHRRQGQDHRHSSRPVHELHSQCRRRRSGRGTAWPWISTRDR